MAVLNPFSYDQAVIDTQSNPNFRNELPLINLNLIRYQFFEPNPELSNKPMIGISFGLILAHFMLAISYPATLVFLYCMYLKMEFPASHKKITTR